MGPIPANGSHYPIGRTEQDDSATYFRMYDRQGVLVPDDPLVADYLPGTGIGYRPDSVAPLPPYPEHESEPPPPDECFDGCVPEPTGHRASLQRSDPEADRKREWLDNIVVTPNARATDGRARRFGGWIDMPANAANW